MHDSTILTITNDKTFLNVFRKQLHDQVAGGSRMIVAGTIDEACSILETARPHLIVMHWGGEKGSYTQLDRLLWTTTVQSRRVPVLVIADRYRTDQATMMYRMGVSEYISRSHHLDQLGPVFSAYLPLEPISAEAVSADQADKAWSSKRKAKAGAVANRAV
jgi:DNA-binding NarL/FixJ family response regulator